MEDYKQYLSEGADDSERDAAKQILEGLSGIRLEQKVQEVAAERRAWLRRRFWARVAFWAALVLIPGVAFLIFQEKEKSALPSQPQNIQQPDGLEKRPNIDPQAPIEEKKNIPIADNRVPGKTPLYPAPIIRGEQNENKPLKALLDQIWETDYPPKGLILSETFVKADSLLKARDFSAAYVQLQRLERRLPANDTLRLLKGHCLLEMGESADALRYLDGLDQQHANWTMRLEWYSGLALLLQDNKQAAGEMFRKIAANPSHTYRQQAERARKLLK